VKILVVVPKFPPETFGGAEFVSMWLSEAFGHQGHEVMLLTEESAEPDERFQVQGVEVVRAIKSPRAAGPSAYIEVLKAYRRFDPDVIHGHHVYPTGLWLHPLMRLSSVPVYVTSHAEDIRGNSEWDNGIRANKLKRPMVEAAAKSCSKLILCGSNLVSEAEDIQLPEDQYTVINNCIPLNDQELSSDTSSGIRAAYNLDSDKKLVFTIGRLVPKKGLELILDAADNFDLDGYQFVIAGTGPLESKLVSQVRERELDNVHVVGRISEEHKRAFFQECDMFLFTSYSEGFPITILEAMKHGCNILASDIPGPRDVINAQNAVLFEPGDSEDLGRKISQADWDGKSEAARRDIKRLRPEKVAKQYLSVFRET
jgi:glycosyltransferase involved in cell wall biosynthesis